ncbi:MAG: Nramp family divalent metal transporter [Anaerolineae bacterium]|nr:Nramp family divalent metal transporter [Anaerolineae bacterium]
MATKEPETLQIGVSRPPLPLDDLPTPEEVFNKPKIGTKELITAVLGPSMIALGVSLGSGEWLLGPLAFGKFGFIGLGWLITISAILQVFYNVENARYTLATGEVPVVGFSRTPPGFRFWILVTLFIIYLGWIWGGWASTAGQSIFALFMGRTFDSKVPGELQTVRFIAIGLMILSLVIYMFGKKIARTLELIDTVLVFVTLGTVTILALIFAPASVWGEALVSAVVPGVPPKGIDATTLGSIIGYTGFGSGMNFMLINYYRDHGYGMGHKVGFFSGLVGGQKKDVLPSGVTFRESEKNTKLWNRWFRYLVIDQWVVFFIGAMIGMFVPSILVVALTRMPGAGVPSTANIPVYAATELAKKGAFFFPFILLLGAMILFKTQTTILEMLVRNTADSAIAVSGRLRKWIHGDARRAYYTLAVLFIIVISVVIHLALPTDLLRISANMANLASIIYPLVLLYLNSKLPRPARAPWWAYVAMVANVLFFGFFFVNFVVFTVTGTPLVKF